jgi:hypothetical protein
MRWIIAGLVVVSALSVGACESDGDNRVRERDRMDDPARNSETLRTNRTRDDHRGEGMFDPDRR